MNLLYYPKLNGQYENWLHRLDYDTYPKGMVIICVHRIPIAIGRFGFLGEDIVATGDDFGIQQWDRD